MKCVDVLNHSDSHLFTAWYFSKTSSPLPLHDPWLFGRHGVGSGELVVLFLHLVEELRVGVEAVLAGGPLTFIVLNSVLDLIGALCSLAL